MKKQIEKKKLHIKYHVRYTHDNLCEWMMQIFHTFLKQLYKSKFYYIT